MVASKAEFVLRSQRIAKYSSGDRTINDAVTSTLCSPPQSEPESAENSPEQLRGWFTNLFPNRLSSAIRTGESGRWLEVSRFHQLSDEEIIEAIETRGKFQRGFRLDDKTMFLVLSIPRTSPYHSTEFIEKLRGQMLKQLQMAPRHYQIDEDWYLYLFMTALSDTEIFSRELANWCRKNGYELGPDTLLVHPSEQAIPFPLQKRFAWLNDRCQLLVRRTELTSDDALCFFLEDAGKHSIEPSALIQRLRGELPDESSPTDELKEPAEQAADTPGESPDPQAESADQPEQAADTPEEALDCTQQSENGEELTINTNHDLPGQLSFLAVE